MSLLMRLFFALSFELKAGRIGQDDLRSRLDKIVAGSLTKSVPTPMSRASSRYPGTHLHDPILPDDLLVDILVRGIVDPCAIRSALDRSPHFAAPKEEQAWRAVWNSVYRTEADFKDAVARLNNDIEKRLVLVPGEILHAFGEYLWLADIGESRNTRAQVIAEAKRYIDDIYAKRSLQPLAENARGHRDFPVHEGYGFMQAHTPEFQEILRHMEATRKKAAIDLYQSQTEELLRDMMTNPDVFARRITYSGGDEAKYANVPLLATLDSVTFVKALLGLRLDAQ